jgi:hypothetical protein
VALSAAALKSSETEVVSGISTGGESGLVIVTAPASLPRVLLRHRGNRESVTDGFSA